MLPRNVLRWAVAIVLVAAGLLFLLRHPHPRWAFGLQAFSRW
jgi:hypothetical protein